MISDYVMYVSYLDVSADVADAAVLAMEPRLTSPGDAEIR